MSDLRAWTPRPRPERQTLEGRFVRLEPLDPGRHGDDLFAASAAPGAEDRFRWLFESPPDPAYFESLIDDATRQRRAATLATVTALEDWRPGASLSAITAPRRVVSGARDPLITPQHAKACAAALGCPIDLLPDVGHALIPEAPQAIADALATLVRA